MSMAEAAVARNLSVVHLTLTMAHNANTPSVALRKRLDRAWSLFTDGRRVWRRIACSAGVWGLVAIPDYTWSAASGHHHHLHVVVIAERGEVLVDAADELAAAWCAAAEAAGGWATRQRGLRVAGVARIASEARRIALHAPHAIGHAPADGHLSSWDLLEAAAAGDEQAATVWVEYAAAVHGTRRIRTTPGLAARLGVFEPEHEPCRAIVAEIPAALIGRVCLDSDWICLDSWAAATIRAAGGPAAMLDQVEEILDGGGVPADVQRFVQTLIGAVQRDLMVWAVANRGGT